MVAGGGVCNRCNVKGFRFQPTDEELVDHHLNPKILDPDSGRHYIGDIKDLSQFDPSDLFRITQRNPDDKEGYFFWSPTYKNGRIIRKGKNGYWSETRGCVPIDSAAEEESVIAKKRVFVFCKGVYPGTRTAWFIYQIELAVSHQDEKEIFVCKLVEHKQKDRVSGSKRKGEQNAQEKSAKPRRAKKDNSLRKKAKVSGAQETQLDDEHNNNNTIMSCEVVHGNHQSLPSDLDSIVLSGELIPQSYHLPSKDFSSNNMFAGGHHWSPGGLDPSNGFLDDVQSFDDNHQCHHLSSNSINSIPMCVGMQPSHHFPSSTPEEISNEDPRYNERRKEEPQLSFKLPLDPKNDIISSGLLQRSHRLPSNCEESIESFDAYEKSQPKLPTPEGGSLDFMDKDTNYYLEFNIEEMKALLSQPPTTPEEISNEDRQYNERRKEEPQLSFQLPLDPKNDIISSGLLQRSHHLPSNCEESIESFDAYEKSQPKLPTPEGGSLDFMDKDTNYYLEFNIEEMKALIRQPQPPTTPEVHSCNDLPPASDLSRGTDKFQEQCVNSEPDDASFWASLLQD